MIQERCVTCGVLIEAADRERFEKRYDRHQKQVHDRPVVAGGPQ